MGVPGAEAFVPETADLHGLAVAAADCQGCELFQHAEQTVFGRGTAGASMMLVGEQPGDREDRAVDRDGLYVTNAVKHFKFTERGKRRIHQKPSRTEVVACRPWLIAELDVVVPEVLVLLGATAAQSLLGSTFRLTQHRGTELRLPENEAPRRGRDAKVVATVHPSAILRGRPEDRDDAFDALVADLRFAAGLLPC